MFETFDVKKLQKLARDISERTLVQIEGATCSGKSTLLLAVNRFLKQKGIKVMILEEAASLVLKENQNLLEQLIIHAAGSELWRNAKIKLQQKVLKTQIECLERFAKEDNFEIALMDRGGASTLFHTLPLLSDIEKRPLENICKEITRMSDQIILLPYMGFLQQGSFRYQNNLKEIEDEFVGIKHYLDKWKVNYLKIPRKQSNTQAKIAVQKIFKIKKLCSILEQTPKQTSRC